MEPWLSDRPSSISEQLTKCREPDIAAWRWILMPRYFFNVYHERSEPDEVGEVLPDRQAAWKEATTPPVKFSRVWMGNCSPAAIGGWRLRTSLPTRYTSSVSAPNTHLDLALTP
jgi:hypothetical protein